MRQSLFRIVMTRVKMLRNRDPQTVRHRVGWLGVSFARFVACAALAGVSIACGGTESMSPVESGGLVAERRGDSAEGRGGRARIRGAESEGPGQRASGAGCA